MGESLKPIMRTMSRKMLDALMTVADARNGEISGWKVATWLFRSFRCAER